MVCDCCPLIWLSGSCRVRQPVCAAKRYNSNRAFAACDTDRVAGTMTGCRKARTRAIGNAVTTSLSPKNGRCTLPTTFPEVSSQRSRRADASQGGPAQLRLPWLEFCCSSADDSIAHSWRIGWPQIGHQSEGLKLVIDGVHETMRPNGDLGPLLLRSIAGSCTTNR